VVRGWTVRPRPPQRPQEDDHERRYRPEPRPSTSPPSPSPKLQSFAHSVAVDRPAMRDESPNGRRRSVRKNFSVLVTRWISVDNRRLRPAFWRRGFSLRSVRRGASVARGDALAQGVAPAGRGLSLSQSGFHLLGMYRLDARPPQALCRHDDDRAWAARKLRVGALPRLQSLWRSDPRHPGTCRIDEVAAGPPDGPAASCSSAKLERARGLARQPQHDGDGALDRGLGAWEPRHRWQPVRAGWSAINRCS
jgi:hypothetical protein